MAEGTIKRLTDKGFGFIETGTDKDMFFHNSNLEGVSYDELREGQRVSYERIETKRWQRREERQEKSDRKAMKQSDAAKHGALKKNVKKKWK